MDKVSHIKKLGGWSENSKHVVFTSVAWIFCSWSSQVHERTNGHNNHRWWQGCAQVLDQIIFEENWDNLKIRCGVDSPASSPMQWTKDGFGLGHDPRLPEYPNYSMIHDEEGTSSEATSESCHIQFDLPNYTTLYLDIKVVFCWLHIIWNDSMQPIW